MITRSTRPASNALRATVNAKVVLPAPGVASMRTSRRAGSSAIGSASRCQARKPAAGVLFTCGASQVRLTVSVLTQVVVLSNQRARHRLVAQRRR